MLCPECGYMMTAFDKECLRCKNLAKSKKNPYVAFQEQQTQQQALPTQPVKTTDTTQVEICDTSRQPNIFTPAATDMLTPPQDTSPTLAECAEPVAEPGRVATPLPPAGALSSSPAEATTSTLFMPPRTDMAEEAVTVPTPVPGMFAPAPKMEENSQSIPTSPSSIPTSSSFSDKPPNYNLIRIMWVLTAIHYLLVLSDRTGSFTIDALIFLGLPSTVIAIILACSEAKIDRKHGFVKLALMVPVVIALLFYFAPKS